MIQRKSFPAQFKAVGEDGTFEAIVSVFGNVDLAGDRVVKGAFADNLKEWKESGDPIPVIWSHMWDNPDAHIGKVLAAEERDDGLWVKAQVDKDDPYAMKIHKLLSERRVREFSFAYDVEEEEKNDGANELRKLSIIEVGPTLKGMNPDTQLLAAKSGLMGEAFKAALESNASSTTTFSNGSITSGSITANTITVPREVKAGRVLSAKNETKLREARDAIDAVLKSIEKDEEKTREQAPGLSFYKTRIALEELEDTA